MKMTQKEQIKPYKFPEIKCELKDGHYEWIIPIEWFHGCTVHDAETNEFLGWVDGKNHTVGYYSIKEIVRNEKNNTNI